MFARSNGGRDERQPLAQRFQRVNGLVEPISVRTVKPSMPNRVQVDAAQPSQLPVEQHARAHFDVAHQHPQRRRQPQGVDHQLHDERRLAGPRRAAEHPLQPRLDFQASQFTCSHGIQRRRSSAQHGIGPSVDQIRSGRKVRSHDVAPKVAGSLREPSAVC